MIDMHTDTSTAESSVLTARELGGRQRQQETSIWTEWSRLNAKLNIGSAIQLYENFLARTVEDYHAWVESTLTPAEANLEGVGDLTRGPIGLPAWLCYSYRERVGGRSPVQLFQAWAAPLPDPDVFFWQTQFQLSLALATPQTVWAHSCKSVAARRFVQSAEALVESLIDIEYVGPQLELIASGYLLRVPSEVLEFIWDHPYLQPLLVEARQRLREYFPSAELVLDVIRDREVDGWEELVILVSTGLPVEEAAAMLERLDDEWWLDRLPDARGMLSIDLAFE